jgi:hypothetical protein
MWVTASYPQGSNCVLGRQSFAVLLHVVFENDSMSSRGETMKQSETYSIILEEEDVVIRVHGDLVDQEALTKLLDYLELESIRKRSKLTEAQANVLAAEVDRNVWEKTKEKLIGE